MAKKQSTQSESQPCIESTTTAGEVPLKVYARSGNGDPVALSIPANTTSISIFQGDSISITSDTSLDTLKPKRRR
jgi:hypothetical protein